MATVGFHASHEQISLRRLLQGVHLAEQAGFDAAMCADHIEPWSARQGHLHFVGQEQTPFIEAFAEHVLPQLRPAAGPAPFGTDGAL